jgi:hypothetical protein
MYESGRDHRVVVTAQKRAHPAIAKLARACIELARRAVAASPAKQPPVATRTSDTSQSPEVPHD